MTTSIDNTYLDIPVKRDGDYYSLERLPKEE